MVRVPRLTRGHASALALGLALSFAAGCATPQPAPAPSAPPPSSGPISPLSADDVSWLFPAPQTAADLASLIRVQDLGVWTDADFQNFLAIADSDQAQVAGGAKINLPAGVRDKSVWFVAGVRIDAGAPGLDPAIMAAFGQRPQVRLILQAVLTGPDGSPQVQDLAAHLIFDFVAVPDPAPSAACPLLHATPDLVTFKGVVADAAALRTALASGQFAATPVVTAGLPLGVHPGLANTATRAAVTQQMKALLQSHLSPVRMNAMAMMGLPTPAAAPWIFLSMQRNQTGAFTPVLGPTLDGTQFAMELTPAGQSPRVVPTPHPNNLAPITCFSGAFGPAASPVASRQGHSTSEVFATGTQDPAAVQAATDLVADPTKSHFFNTDCVSCHTETRRQMDLLKITSAPGLSPDVMPNSQYNVRNFGWSPPSAPKPIRATATRRTANETASVVAWLNANLLN